jgi:hypothetical protein
MPTHSKDTDTMTAQFSESITYQGRQQAMCTEPLADYFELAGIESPFEATCSALWRPPCQTRCRFLMIADDPHWSATYDNKSTFN